MQLRGEGGGRGEERHDVVLGVSALSRHGVGLSFLQSMASMTWRGLAWKITQRVCCCKCVCVALCMACWS
jgi:hypothetical protein